GGAGLLEVLARGRSRPVATQCLRRNQSVSGSLTPIEHDVGHFPTGKGELNSTTDLRIVQRSDVVAESEVLGGKNGRKLESGEEGAIRIGDAVNGVDGDGRNVDFVGLIKIEGVGCRRTKAKDDVLEVGLAADVVLVGSQA